MTVIAKVIKGLEFLRNNEKALVREIIIERSDDVEDLQRDQLLRGKTNVEKNVAPRYRNPRYARKKQSMNPRAPNGVPDLKLTGRYHKKFKLKVQGSKGKLINTDKKDAMLTKKYDNIKGLSPVSIAKLRQMVIIDLRRDLKKRLLR